MIHKFLDIESNTKCFQSLGVSLLYPLQILSSVLSDLWLFFGCISWDDSPPIILFISDRNVLLAAR